MSRQRRVRNRTADKWVGPWAVEHDGSEEAWVRRFSNNDVAAKVWRHTDKEYIGASLAAIRFKKPQAIDCQFACDEHLREQGYELVDAIQPAPTFKKADAEKVRMDLLPPRALLAVGRVLTFGAQKYAPGNWRNIPEDERHRYTAAAFRHLLAIMRGEALDAETGESHWAHLVCCALFMLEFHEEEA